MTDKVICMSERLQQRRRTQEWVNIHVLSKETYTALKEAQNEKWVYLQSVQNSLAKATVIHGISWSDLVFYLIVECGLPANLLKDDIKMSSSKEERDIVTCCESRRIELLSYV